MTEISPTDMVQLARGAGFSGDDIGIAVTIAHYESGFRSDASHTNGDGSVDKGLWQINARANADIIAKFGDPFDPARNAAMAYAVYKRQGWGAWSVYRNRASYSDWGTLLGTYKMAATRVPGRITIDGGKENAPGITSPGDSIVKPIGDAISGPLQAVQEFGNKALGFLNIGVGVLVGLVLLSLGVILLARGFAGKVVAGTIKDVAKTAAPKAPPLSVEQRAARSLDYSAARKQLQGQRAQEAAAAARAKLRRVGQ
jgi:Lysozyme like domain